VGAARAGLALFHKKISKSWRVFRLPKTRVQNTTFHHPSTTISPSKHHAKTRSFSKTPSKIARKQQKLLPTSTRIFFAKTRGLGLQNGLEEQTDPHHP
jgi:hypothetical protein